MLFKLPMLPSLLAPLFGILVMASMIFIPRMFAALSVVYAVYTAMILFLTV
jgi:hypothetical protein